MNPTTTTATDRYVWAAGRNVPEAQRAELERELRERIGDAVDARLVADDGTSLDDAERATLTELGDPAAVAASYLDRPLQLIGPRYFLVWWRLLKLLWAIVVPVVAAAMLLAQILAGVGIGAIIGGIVVVTLQVTVHLGFWTTLVFAVIDRFTAPALEPEWTPDLLPITSDETRMSRLSGLVTSILLLGLFAAVLVGQQFGIPWVPPLESVPLLNPALWSFWLPYFLALIVLEIGFAIVLFRTGWTWALAVANIALNVAFTGPALWLVTTGQLMNPDALEAMRWPWGDSAPVLVALTVTLIVVASAWDVISGFLEARRARYARMQHRLSARSGGGVVDEIVRRSEAG